MKIALDWTPNVMHAGLFLAKAKGWLEADFISPVLDDYMIMPSEKVLTGMADFCIGPPETVISHHLTYKNPQLLIVAPILQSNTSAIVARKDRNIQSISDWDGKSYAALDIPFEKELLHFILQKSGNGGILHTTNPLKLDTWKLLQNGEADLTWIFMPVEGAEAQYKELDLQVFKLEEFGIPYPPCPLIQTSRNLAEADPGAIEHLLEAAQRGYQYAIDYPEEAVTYLRQQSELNWIEDVRLLLHCQKAIAPFYLNIHGQWGKMNFAPLTAYVRWLHSENIISREIDSHSLFYTSVIPEAEMGE